MTQERKVKFEWLTWITLILSTIVISYNIAAWVGWKPFGDQEALVNWILLPLAVGIDIWRDFVFDSYSKLSQKEKHSYILTNIMIVVAVLIG